MSLRDLALGAVRAVPWAEPFARRVYSWLPARLHDTPTSRAKMFFAGEEAVTFVEIGAYDGVAGDPIRPLVLANPGWQGVLIEPQRDVFLRLQANYQAEEGRLRLINAAVSAMSGAQKLYVIPPEEMARLSLPAWGGEVASFDPEHLRRHFPHARLAEHEVPTVTFAEAAALLPEGRVDLLAIDVEGHERAILETVDFERHCLRFIIYEHKHMAAADLEVVEARLAGAGFATKRFGRDTIAWRKLCIDRVEPKVTR